MASVNKRTWTSPKGEKKEAWIVRYIDVSGAHRGRTFQRKKEADAYCRQVEIELEQKSHIARTVTVSVGELLDRYEEACALRHQDGRRMSDSHLRSIKAQFRLHVRPHLSNVMLTDLTFVRLDEWANNLSRNPRISVGTIKNIMSMFKVALDFAIRRGWVKHNPIIDVMREHRGGKREIIKTFTKADVRTMLDVLVNDTGKLSDRGACYLRCYVYLALFCGMRWGEIAGLTAEHVDFGRSTIEVRHSLNFKDVLKEPKTKAGIRNVPMPAIVANELRAWLASHYVPNDRNLLFRSSTGAYIGSAYFHHGYWHPLLKRCGLERKEGEKKHFHFHALRHFCASMMVEHGVPLTDAAELLGHSSFDMTLQIYAHAIMASEKRVEVLQSIADNLIASDEAKVVSLPEPRRAA